MSQAGQFYRNGLISTLTGDIGGVILPVAGNIDILGGPGVTVTGTVGTLTIDVLSASATFPTDAGTATPLAGVLNILGGANINTTGVGNTVTAILDDNVTLAGQLEADSVESITYITAGTNITSFTGNISAPTGNIVAGGAITATGDITSTGGDLNATTGNLDVGGVANVVGDITSSMGDVVAQNDIQAVTGNIFSSLGSVSASTTITAGTGISSITGNITALVGDLVATLGNVTAGNNITAGVNLTVATGDLLVGAGDINVALGDIITTVGDIYSADAIVAVGNITSTGGNIATLAGNVTATGSVIATVDVTSSGGNIAANAGNVTASGNIISTAGNITASAGTVNASGDIITTGGDLVSLTGDIRATSGTLFVGTFSSAGDIVSTGGNVISSIGDVISGDKVIAGNGILVTAGGIVVSAGDIVTTTGSITAINNLTAVTGNINAPIGDITAGFDLVAGADISSIMGDVTAEQGDVLARYDIEALEGDIIAHVGDIRTITGFIRSASSVIADANLKVTGTIQFTDFAPGGLITDNNGFVGISGALSVSTGFQTWSGAGAYYDDSVLGSFQILRGGTGYIYSQPITWTGPQTVTGMTAGNTYIIYMDDTGTIGKTTAFTQATFEDRIVLFECLRDSTAPTNTQRTVKENHPDNFPVASSWYAHEVIGTVIENNDQGANITLNGTQKIEIVGDDELADHGLYTDIDDSSGVGVTWCQMFTNGAGKWAEYTTSDTFDGYWNNAGTATAPTGNKWSLYTLYVSKDDLNSATPTYWAVLDDQEYTNLAGAQGAIALGTNAIATNELAALEFAQLGYIIYRQSTSTIVDVIISKSTLRSTLSGGGGANQASLISTNIDDFDGILSAADTTVQSSLNTIDEWGKTTTDHAVLLGQGTGTPIISTSVGTNGQVIIGSTGADPDFANIISTDSSISITEGAGSLDLEIASPLGVPTGGTGLTTITDHGVMVGSGVGAVTPLAVGTNGQLLVGSTGADPVFATVASADSSIEITGGAGTIDLSASGILTINAQTGTTYEFVLGDVSKLVTCSNAAAIALTVPVNADVAIPIGSQILVTQKGAGVVTFTPEGGVTLSSRGSFLDTNGQYATVALIKVDTNIWYVSGDLA